MSVCLYGNKNRKESGSDAIQGMYICFGVYDFICVYVCTKRTWKKNRKEKRTVPMPFKVCLCVGVYDFICVYVCTETKTEKRAGQMPFKVCICVLVCMTLYVCMFVHKCT